MPYRLKVGDPVYVEWEDSYGCSPNWENLPDGGEPETMVCRSIGWICRKSPRAVTIVPHMARNARMDVNQGCGDMVIPLAAILKVTRLKLKT